MNKILICFLILVCVACDTQGTETTVVEDLDITIAVEPDPPSAGESTLMVTVNDAEGSPVEGAVVAVHGDMDHEGMVPVDSESAESQNGVYEVPFTWTMGGGWILDVTVTLPDDGGSISEQFEFDVGAIPQDSIINRDRGDEPGTTIHYMPDNDPALAGDGTITIMVTAADGTPVNDASISLVGNMPAHDMMPVTAEADTGQNGRYVLPVRWTMAGQWEVSVDATLADGTEINEIFEQEVIMAEGEGMDMDTNSDE